MILTYIFPCNTMYFTSYTVCKLLIDSNQGLSTKARRKIPRAPIFLNTIVVRFYCASTSRYQTGFLCFPPVIFYQRFDFATCLKLYPPQRTLSGRWQTPLAMMFELAKSLTAHSDRKLRYRHNHVKRQA